jgi:hypothetical protein
METIKNYLDALFLKLPDTYEARNAKRDLLALTEDKYEELIREGMAEHEAVGRVISDFGNLDEIADDLGFEKMPDGSFRESGKSENYGGSKSSSKKDDDDEVYYENKTVATIMEVFWPSVVCIYLIWSFITFDWHITWIIFVIGAIVRKIVESIWGEER